MAEQSRTNQVEDLHLVNLTKRFGDMAAVDDLTITIPAGSFFALLGPHSHSSPDPSPSKT